jgi:excisionase family DNA binding protein
VKAASMSSRLRFPSDSDAEAATSGHTHGRRYRNDQIKFFTIADVADFLGVSVRTVRRWIKSGALVAHHFGTAVRIAESDLKAFIARHRDP